MSNSNKRPLTDDERATKRVAVANGTSIKLMIVSNINTYSSPSDSTPKPEESYDVDGYLKQAKIEQEKINKLCEQELIAERQKLQEKQSQAALQNTVAFNFKPFHNVM
jgi:CRISPR/Cas system-associated exonuclease Cas4 (RecB family)